MIGKRFIYTILFSAILITAACKKKRIDNNNQNEENFPGHELIAYYPLTSDCKEANGRNNDFDCINVQYDNKGVYLNGVYFFDANGGGSKAEVNISGFDPDNFIIEFEYKAEEDFKPVFVGGVTYRWLYLYIHNGNLRLDILMDNGYFDSKILEHSTPLNTMRKIRIQYKKSENNSIKIYINDTQVQSYQLQAPLDSHGDWKFSSNHYGYGFNFKGYWKNMKFYRPE